MKIFFGLNNIASMYGDLKASFSELGIETFCVNKELPATIINDNSDFNIKKAKNRFPLFKPRRISAPMREWWDKKVDNYIYKRAIKECDVFVFLWESFKPDHSDLSELKKAGKTVINVFVGDDVRWYYGMKQEFESFAMQPMIYDKNYDYTINGLQHRLKLIRTVEANSDFIFSRLDQAQLELRPYYRWNMMVNPKKFINKPEQRQIPIVAHAPSNRNIKGTDTVLEVFERLKKESIAFEPLLIEDVPNEKAIEMYGNADIVIDQLICPGTGKLATESLACGSIVMGHMAYDKYPQKNPTECPIIDVNTENLYDKLKELILNYEFRREHAKKSRPFVEKYLDVQLFCQKIADLANGKTVPFDYEPSFFRTKFIPESEESKIVYNKWTAVVSNCNWYKNTIQPGERAGLQF